MVYLILIQNSPLWTVYAQYDDNKQRQAVDEYSRLRSLDKEVRIIKVY